MSRRLFSLPRPVLRRLAGKAVILDGNELDPAVQIMLALAKVVTPEPLGGRAVDVSRREMKRSSGMLATRTKGVATTNRTIDGPAGPIPIRVYRPRAATPRSAATVFFHGGGFVLGDLDTHDSVCRSLASGAGHVVVAVDYRLAPEHPWPAAPDDCYAAFCWVVENARALGIDPARIGVAGDSAGGNVSAVVCLDAKTRGGPSPKAQLLMYPATELRRSMTSHRTFAEGFLLTKADIDWFIDHYVPGGGDALDHPRASPFKAKDLSGLPAAFVQTAAFDPLRDEGMAYAERLAAAGVKTVSRCYEGLIHGFASFGGGVPAAGRALDEGAAWLAKTV